MNNLLWDHVNPSNLPSRIMALVHALPSPLSLFRNLRELFDLSARSHYRWHTIEATRSPHDFDVDRDTGFLPNRPLDPLSGPYALWERALTQAPDVLSLGEDTRDEAIQKHAGGKAWRANIEAWPVLHIGDLENDSRALKRAHLVLAFLMHYYVHSVPQDEREVPVHIPAPLAVPLIQVSERLCIAPILTFADTVLWNWELLDPTRPVSIDNILMRQTFTGTEDEKNFYRTNLEVELRAVELLQIIDQYNNLPHTIDEDTISTITRYLTQIKGIVEDCGTIMQSVRPICDPYTFYWDIRPWLEGSDAGGPDSTPWIFEGVNVTGSLPLSGPSGGQSSGIHALDIFLGVDHKNSHPAPTDKDGSVTGFMERMRLYMPGQHREYLAYLGRCHRPLRSLAKRTPALQEAYNGAVKAAQRMRDVHMRTACLYIITMSKTTPGAKSGCPASVMLERLAAQKNAGQASVRGTGGNEVAKLLTHGRNTTKEALLKV